MYVHVRTKAGFGLGFEKQNERFVSGYTKHEAAYSLHTRTFCDNFFPFPEAAKGVEIRNPMLKLSFCVARCLQSFATTNGESVGRETRNGLSKMEGPILSRTIFCRPRPAQEVLNTRLDFASFYLFGLRSIRFFTQLPTACYSLKIQFFSKHGSFHVQLCDSLSCRLASFSGKELRIVSRCCKFYIIINGSGL